MEVIDLEANAHSTRGVVNKLVGVLRSERGQALGTSNNGGKFSAVTFTAVVDAVCGGGMSNAEGGNLNFRMHTGLSFPLSLLAHPKRCSCRDLPGSSYHKIQTEWFCRYTSTPIL